MSSPSPKTPALAAPARPDAQAAATKTAQAKTAQAKAAEPRPSADHRRPAPPAARASLSATDIAYVQSLMGVIPAEKLETILIKTGIPVPVNLGLNTDTSA